MNAEIAGNLLGRLLMSWFIVFIITLLAKRGKWRSALRASVWPWGLIFVFMLFVMGILGTVVSR